MKAVKNPLLLFAFALFFLFTACSTNKYQYGSAYKPRWKGTPDLTGSIKPKPVSAVQESQIAGHEIYSSLPELTIPGDAAININDTPGITPSVKVERAQKIGPQPEVAVTKAIKISRSTISNEKSSGSNHKTSSGISGGTGGLLIGLGVVLLVFISILLGLIIILLGVIVIASGSVGGTSGTDRKKDEKTNNVDVVYLKNGSMIKGTLIEQIPNGHVKIKTRDGSIFVYKMDEVEKITKEPAN